MGTIAQKFNYSFEAKDLIKDSINNLGGSITSETELKEYATELDNIYSNLPKVTGEGTNITLSPTLKGKLDFEDGIVGIGDTKQEGTPTPDNPQEIEVVRGKNRIPLNEADFTTTYYGQNVEIKDQNIKISGSATNIYSISVGKNGLVTPTDTNRITFKVNSGTYKYTQFSSGTAYSGVNVRLKDEDTNTMYTSGSTITLTETHTFSINIFMADADSKNAEIKIQLEKGSQATSYLPYNTLEVVERGKNLCNNETLVQGYYNGATQTWVNSPNHRSSDYISINKDTTYKASLFDKNKNFIGNLVYATFDENKNFVHQYTTSTITPTSEEKFVRIRNYDAQISYITSNDYLFQLEQGSTATTYEPYQTPQTYQLSLGNFKPSKIGNYKDYFYRTSGKNLWEFGNYIGNATKMFDFTTPLPKGTYTFSFNIINATAKAMDFYSSDNVRIKNLYIAPHTTITKVTSTFTADIEIAKVQIYSGDSADELTNIQLELGNTATDYNPYGSGEWYFKGKIAEVILNSSYRASGGTTGTNAYYIATKLTDGLNDNAIALAYSNMFSPCAFNDRAGAPDSVMLQSGSVTLRTRNNTDIDWSDNTKRDNWLNTNLPIVYYVLAIPTDTKITDTNMITQLEDIYNLMSYTGTTIITSNGNLPMIIKVRALKGE